MADYFDSGFAVRQASWHGLETLLDEHPTDWQHARQLAGLTWEPKQVRAFIERDAKAFANCRDCGVGIDQPHAEGCIWEGGKVLRTDCLPQGAQFSVDPSVVFVPDLTRKVIVRSDTMAVLGVTGEGYATIHHGEKEAVDQTGSPGASMEYILDAFKDADGGLKFETAGSVKGGQRVYALLYLDEPFEIPGDPHGKTVPYIAVINNHDGAGACTVMRTQVRVVCWNTTQMAYMDSEESGLTYTFRHTANVAERIEEAKKALQGLREEVVAYKAMCAELLDINVSDQQVRKFLSEFLPNPAENGEVVSDRVQANVDKARELWRDVYGSVTCEGIQGTALGLYQAGTEYLDHIRKYRTRDSYLGRTVLRAEPLKSRLLTLARSV